MFKFFTGELIPQIIERLTTKQFVFVLVCLAAGILLVAARLHEAAQFVATVF